MCTLITMDKLQTLAHLLIVFALCYEFVDGLIGLRPPDQTPHKEIVKKPRRPVSPKPSELHRTQLYSPYDHPDTPNNVTVIETELEQDRDKCQTIDLLRCSSQLLRHSIPNDTDVCRNTKQFTDCILDTLREYGRKEYVTALVVVNDIRFAVRQTFHCLVNDSAFNHLRHRIAKRNGGACCTEDLLNCAIQTLFKMSTNRKERCNLVNFYDVCLLKVSESCQSKSLTTLYPVFVSQIKRQCGGKNKRRKRSTLMKRVFSDWT